MTYVASYVHTLLFDKSMAAVSNPIDYLYYAAVNFSIATFFLRYPDLLLSWAERNGENKQDEAKGGEKEEPTLRQL
jgi:hypothetical protein